jgi:two-component sensor histidine kinase
MTSPSPNLSHFQREISDRFGLLPNFFSSAPDAPEIIEKLWNFAKSAYVENSIPAVFKERLFVYLSRFCEARYCIARHCGFLLGYGHASGDSAASPQTIEQAISLLKRLPPWQRYDEAWLVALETGPTVPDWPSSGTDIEDQLFSAAVLVFMEAGRSTRARRALHHALGGTRFEHLLGLLAFIRTAHYWTVIHPDLPLEEDVQALLSVDEELARLLLEDPEAARCDMGTLLFSELEDLRALRERHELETAKHMLEAKVEQKEVLLKEVNHRVKNSLQIVSGLLHLGMAQIENAEAAEVMRGAAARVLAIAAVHERLYTGDDVKVVALDAFLGNLCGDIARALGCAARIEIDLGPTEVPTDMAVPLALIVNELVTNAIKYADPPYRITMRKKHAHA